MAVLHVEARGEQRVVRAPQVAKWCEGPHHRASGCYKVGISEAPTIVGNDGFVAELSDGDNNRVVRTDVKLTEIIKERKKKNVEDENARVERRAAYDGIKGMYARYKFVVGVLEDHLGVDFPPKHYPQIFISPTPSKVAPAQGVEACTIGCYRGACGNDDCFFSVHFEARVKRKTVNHW